MAGSAELMRFPGLCPPLRLWTRIAAMMFLAVLAVEALNAVVFVFIPCAPDDGV